MKVEGIGTMGVGMMMGIGQDMDATGRNIQNQIQKKQQELQKLSENESISPEEKMKKRQEIQQEIADLNMQLRQHKMELRRERQQNKGSSVDEAPGGRQQAASDPKKGQDKGISQTAMTAIISADSSMKQAQVQGNVSDRMEGRAGVLRAEIKQDAALHGDTSKKEQELAETEQKAADVAASQLNTLGKANKTMEKAAKEERENRKEESGKVEDGKTEDDRAKNKEEAEQDDYAHVDVRL